MPKSCARAASSTGGGRGEGLVGIMVPAHSGGLHPFEWVMSEGDIESHTTGHQTPGVRKCIPSPLKKKKKKRLG